LDLALVQSAIVCSAKFDVLQVAQAAAGGDAARALHILQCLQSLREDGTEPVLTLWTLVREIRGLWQSKEQARLRSSARSGWNLAATPAAAATRRIGQLPLAALLESAGQVDLIVKGHASGDSWSALTALTLTLAGGLPASMLRLKA
jgi:DNA polymerase III delta subunit